MRINHCLKQRMLELMLMVCGLLLPGMAHASMPADTKVTVDFKSAPVTTVLNAIQN